MALIYNSFSDDLTKNSHDTVFFKEAFDTSRRGYYSNPSNTPANIYIMP